MKRRLHLFANSLVLVLAIVAAGPLAAQQLELSIEDSTVYINGKEVLKEMLPAGLDLREFNFRYMVEDVPAGEYPAIEINGILVLIGKDRLTQIFDPTSIPEDGAISIRTPRPGGGAIAKIKEAEELARDMRATTAGLQATIRFVEPNARDAAITIRAAQEQLEEAAVTLQMLPDMQAAWYYDSVLKEDLDLYSQLSAEWALEREAAQLAAEIRRMQAGPERTRMMQQLRERLSEIFERKQENRRQEIRQLEYKLRNLRDRVTEREKVRLEIIERRLKELLANGF